MVDDACVCVGKRRMFVCGGVGGRGVSVHVCVSGYRLVEYYI